MNSIKILFDTSLPRVVGREMLFLCLSFAVCEEYESFHDRSGRPDMVMGQSIVLSAIKTQVSSDCDDPTNQHLLLQQYVERIEKMSQQDILSKFGMDARFQSVVENGQYFMTKDIGDLTQVHAVACREYQGDLMTCKMKETRPVLKRSMSILLTKNSVLQIEQGDLLKTQLQYKTTLKYIMKPTRSTLMMKYFVKEWRNPLLFMTRIMNR